METKHIIQELRKSVNLSQDEFAEKYNISIDSLLGHPPLQCQSCGMLLEQDTDKGTEQDGRKSDEYCAFCYQHGDFTQDLTIEEIIEHNLLDLDNWNQSAGLHLSEQEAKNMLMQFLPTLKRWQA